MRENENSIKVHMPNGRTVDICTTPGADAFLKAKTSKDDADYLKSNIENAKKIRSKRKLGGKDKEQLKMIYIMIDSLADYSTPEVFRSYVPLKDVEFWVDHVMTVLKSIAQDKRWTATGKLEEHDAFVLNSCVSMFTNAVPVAIAHEKDLFKVLSEVVAARKGKTNSLPCADISETVELIVSNAILTSLYQFDNKWTGEKIFKKLESSGVLLEFIRVTTVAQPNDSFAPPRSVLKSYDELLKCTNFLKKKFKKGEPCGDIVSSILSGKYGYRRNRQITMAKLKAISNMSEIMECDGPAIKMCRNCSKSEMSEEFQQSLMQCSRCKMAYYCSRDCQKANWKSHRKVCIAATKAHTKNVNTTETITLNFARNNYVDIMVELVSVCDSTSLNKGELLLELDFVPSKNGKTPALQDPPVFKIAASRGYFEGSRPNEPNWFYKKEDPKIYQENVKGVAFAIKDQFSRLPPSHLLCLIRYPGGVSCYKISLMGTNGTHLFSDQTVDAFRSAIDDDCFSPLTRILDADQMKAARSQLGLKHGIGISDEEKVDRVKIFLNSKFGADF